MSKRFYRPELDVIRFIAFMAVFIHHYLPSWPAGTVLGAIAGAFGFGLCLFFTLSAYLITTLLCIEKRDKGTIALSSFYKRRALRIWPLYFGAILISAAISYLHHGLAKDGIWYLAALFMLGNVVMQHTTSVIHLWSISVEEQFYTFWPLLVKKLSPARLLTAAIVILCISNIAIAYFGIIHADTEQRIWWNSFVQMESFAGGILLALRDRKYEIKKRSALVRTLSLISIPCIWFCAVYFFQIKGVHLDAKGPISLCIGFALVAASCAWLIDCLQGTSWPPALTYLGRISYGLYVFHVPALSVGRKLMHGRLYPYHCVLALAITIVCAALSFRFYETRFLRLKSRFEVVHSGVKA